MSLPRTVLAGVLLALGAVLLLAGAVLTDAARLLRPPVFADRMAASLRDPAVADFVAVQLTDGVLRGQRDLTAYRPLLLAASRDVVRSDAFAGLVRGTSRRAHAAIFSDVGRGLARSMPDLELVLRSALTGSALANGALANGALANGALGGIVPADVPRAVADLGRSAAVQGMIAGLQRGVALAHLAPWVLGAGALGLALGVWRMPDRRDALVGAGGALVAAGLALWAIGPVGRLAVSALVPGSALRGAVAGLWNVALAGLPAWAVAYTGVGVVLAAAGSSLLERLDVRELATWVHDHALTPPAQPGRRLLRGLALVAVGLCTVLAPRAVLQVATVGTGIVITFVGLRETFAVVLHAAPAALPVRRALADVGEGWAVGGVLVLVLAAAFAALVLLVARPAVEARVARGPTVECNGRAALCGRRVDEVTFAATHNSMSAADHPDWLFPQQERGIPGQLADGVRALLVDVHQGTPVGARVRTLADGDGRGLLGAARSTLGPEGTAAAMRIRDRLTTGAAGPPGLYLCHGFCELGAEPLGDALARIRDFLDTHPGEVLLVVIEDYAPPAAIARAFEASGLARVVYRGTSEPWPTLGALVARDERVIVMLESGRSGVPWLRPAFAVLQETPYAFASAADTLSCAPNRGGTAGSLFQVNHWIETTPAPKPSNAAIVNALPALLERARRCERSRGHRVNLLAVDWYRTGDVVRAAAALNDAADDTRRVRLPGTK